MSTTHRQQASESPADPNRNNPLRQQQLLLVPFVLGVTGHRDLRPHDLETLRQRVHDIFQELRREYPDSPLTLLSPLNEGADRLVAQVAIDEGVELIGVLPWPEVICEERLHRAGERAEFDALLDRAIQFVRCLIDGTDESELQQSEACRQRHYAQVDVRPACPKRL